MKKAHSYKCDSFVISTYHASADTNCNESDLISLYHIMNKAANLIALTEQLSRFTCNRFPYMHYTNANMPCQEINCIIGKIRVIFKIFGRINAYLTGYFEMARESEDC